MTSAVATSDVVGSEEEGGGEGYMEHLAVGEEEGEAANGLPDGWEAVVIPGGRSYLLSPPTDDQGRGRVKLYHVGNYVIFPIRGSP